MFSIDLQSRIPIYEQLYSGITELASKDLLRPGDRIPSVRELAKELGVNPNTVSKAFGMLERDGIIYSVPGRGSFLSDDHGGIIKKNAEKEFRQSVEKALGGGLTKDELISIVNDTGVIK
ncbi:MAG: GntR family transcriptional regulator [Oscillospiraceae bacterium]|nr:GntR family transcriptional regulator [Oscillospiraceae bacterium]